MAENLHHIHLEKVQPLAGFAATDMAPQSFGWILERAFVCSDDPTFYLYSDQISKMFLKDCFVDNVYNYLILIHRDLSADVYVNFPLQAKMMMKRAVKAGEPIYQNDIADIAELRFPGITMEEKDCVIFSFKKGWKFGLFFDLGPADRESTIDIDRLFHDLGTYYRYLGFQELYSVIENTPLFERMFADGWFPFIQLLGGDYEELAKCYKNEIGLQDEVNRFAAKFDRQRISTFTERWWNSPIFQKKKSILNAGIEAYLLATETGYINCVKTLYSEIEGIVRIRYVEDRGSNPTFAQLVEYVKDKAQGKFGPRGTLGFPEEFYQYLKEPVFKNFDLQTGQVVLSRHSVSHGVADQKQYTRTKALQAILILDQMYFYLT